MKRFVFLRLEITAFLLLHFSLSWNSEADSKVFIKIYQLHNFFQQNKASCSKYCKVFIWQLKLFISLIEWIDKIVSLLF
jgi:hypothetical protein